MTRHLTTGFSLDSPSCPFHVSHDVLVMSLPCLSTPPSGPRHFLGMSASFSMYVPFFRCESFPYISRRADWCPCAPFPSHSPCTPLVFISVPCMSLSVPLCFPFISRCFPVMSTSYFLPSFPCTSLHLPIAPQYLPQKHGFPVFSQLGRLQIFCKRRQEPQTSKEPAGGIEPGTCFATPAPRRLRLVERHQIAARSVGGIKRRAGGGGVMGGGYPLSSLRCPTRRAMSAGEMVGF